jgi:hypothetical protein
MSGCQRPCCAELDAQWAVGLALAQVASGQQRESDRTIRPVKSYANACSIGLAAAGLVQGTDHLASSASSTQRRIIPTLEHANFLRRLEFVLHECVLNLRVT